MTRRHVPPDLASATSPTPKPRAEADLRDVRSSQTEFEEVDEDFSGDSAKSTARSKLFSRPPVGPVKFCSTPKPAFFRSLGLVYGDKGKRIAMSPQISPNHSPNGKLVSRPSPNASRQKRIKVVKSPQKLQIAAQSMSLASARLLKFPKFNIPLNARFNQNPSRKVPFSCGPSTKLNSVGSSENLSASLQISLDRELSIDHEEGIFRDDVEYHGLGDSFTENVSPLSDQPSMTLKSIHCTERTQNHDGPLDEYDQSEESNDIEESSDSILSDSESESTEDSDMSSDEDNLSLSLPDGSTRQIFGNHRIQAQVPLSSNIGSMSSGLGISRSSIGSKKRIKMVDYVEDKLSNASILALRTKHCCQRHCLSSLRIEKIRQIRQGFFRQGADTQAFTLQNIIAKADTSGNKNWKYEVNDILICYIAFKSIYGIGNNRIARLRGLQGGDPRVQHGWGRPLSADGAMTVAWKEDFFKQNVDMNPERDVQHLPDHLTKKEVWLLFCHDVEKEKTGIKCSLSNFRKLWVKYFPKVKIPAVNRFGSCSECTLFKSKIQNASNPAEKKKYEIYLKRHRVQQGKERLKLARHRKKCILNPEKAMGMVIDGMDQKKTRIPHWPRVPKKCDEACLIQMHLVGCMIFHRQLKPRVFLTYPNLANDSNLVITIIQRVLSEWEGVLPPTFYLQLDNTSRENKNNLLMAYLHYLVHHNVFKKIKVNFLIVGHTHDQIDQMFSRISIKLRRKQAVTLPIMESIIHESYDPRPQVDLLTETYDFRRFAFDDASIRVNAVRNLRYNHQLRIKKLREDEPPRFWGKKFSTSPAWRPAEGSIFLKHDFIEAEIYQAKGVPLSSKRKVTDGRQVATAAEMEQSLCEIEKEILLLTQYFNAEDIIWWQSFFVSQRLFNAKLLQGDQRPTTPFTLGPARTFENPALGDLDNQEVVDEETLEEVVFGPTRDIYVGNYVNPARAAEEFNNMNGDLSDLRAKNMICVAAEADIHGRPFWIAEVLSIKERGEDNRPVKIRIQWYTAGNASDYWKAKYLPEATKVVKGKKSRGNPKIFQDDLILSDTTVFCYNFELAKSKKLRSVTIARIKQSIAIESQAETEKTNENETLEEGSESEEDASEAGSE